MLVNKTEKCRLTDPPTRNCSADKKVIRFDDDDEVDDEDGDETQERVGIYYYVVCALGRR